MERTFMKFSGIIKDITSKSNSTFNRQFEYIGLYGLVEILYSRTSNYTLVFAVFILKQHQVILLRDKMAMSISQQHIIVMFLRLLKAINNINLLINVTYNQLLRNN